MSQVGIIGSGGGGGGSTGALVFLSQKIGSGLTVTFDSSIITSTYTNYFVTITNESLGGAALDEVIMQISSDNGSTYESSGYTAGCSEIAYNGSTFTNVNSTASILYAGPISGDMGTSSMYFYLYDLTNNSSPALSGTAVLAGGGNFGMINGYYASSIIVNNIQFSSAGGNSLNGIYTVYGISNS